MKLRILIAAPIAAIMFGAAALAADTGAELFQKGLTQERAAGNLEEAIRIYQRVAKDFASDRALAARALIQEARCYEKLGQDKAIRIYDQVVRDYRDQSEPTAVASARLAALHQADRSAARASMTQRQVELPYSISNVLFSDGHREVYKDAVTGALMITDLAGRDKRAFFKPKAGDSVPGFYPSRDLSIVSIGIMGPDGFKAAVIRTDGTGYHELRESARLAGLPCDPEWSWDNRYLFLCTTQPDETRQLIRISVADGEIRNWAAEGVHHKTSPDGRFIALASSFTNFGRVSVRPAEGGPPQLVSDNARLLDWTRDGRYLIVASARSGSEALYLLPVKEGHLAGDPVFLRYGSCYFGSTNSDGALVCQSTLPGGAYTAWLGTLDTSGRLVNWKRLNLNGSRDRFSALATRWSPDSTAISYEAADEASGRRIVRLRNIATGEDRELYRGSNGLPLCVWAVQQPNLFCDVQGRDPAAVTDVVSISNDSGHVERVGAVTSGGIPFFAGHDDGSLYMAQGDSLIRWQINTGQKTTLDRIPGYPFGGVPIPNEHWMARRDKDTIEIRSMSGDDWKPLISLDPTQMAFTADGSWLLYHDSDVAGKQSLFRVATAGGQPQRIGDFPAASKEGRLNISPDGKKIVAEAPTGTEVWLLENFEPKKPAAH